MRSVGITVSGLLRRCTGSKIEQLQNVDSHDLRILKVGAVTRLDALSTERVRAAATHEHDPDLSPSSQISRPLPIFFGERFHTSHAVDVVTLNADDGLRPAWTAESVGRPTLVGHSAQRFVISVAIVYLAGLAPNAAFTLGSPKLSAKTVLKRFAKDSVGAVLTRPRTGSFPATCPSRPADRAVLDESPARQGLDRESDKADRAATHTSATPLTDGAIQGQDYGVEPSLSEASAGFDSPRHSLAAVSEVRDRGCLVLRAVEIVAASVESGRCSRRAAPWPNSVLRLPVSGGCATNRVRSSDDCGRRAGPRRSTRSPRSIAQRGLGEQRLMSKRRDTR